MDDASAAESLNVSSAGNVSAVDGVEFSVCDGFSGILSISRRSRLWRWLDELGVCFGVGRPSGNPLSPDNRREPPRGSVLMLVTAGLTEVCVCV